MYVCVHVFFKKVLQAQLQIHVNFTVMSDLDCQKNILYARNAIAGFPCCVKIHHSSFFTLLLSLYLVWLIESSVLPLENA